MIVLDPLVLDRHLDRYRRGSRKLADVCAAHGIQLHDAHSADADALAAVRLAWRIAHTHREVGEMSLGELQEAQARWQEEWRAEYEAYRHGKGEAVTIPRGWPLLETEEDANEALERSA